MPHAQPTHGTHTAHARSRIGMKSPWLAHELDETCKAGLTNTITAL